MSLSAGTLVLLLIACGDGGGEPQPERAEISMVEVINQVETGRPREDDERQNFLSAQVGENLILGDGIKTFGASEARVDISLRTSTRVTRTIPNTLWRLGQFGLDEETII